MLNFFSDQPKELIQFNFAVLATAIFYSIYWFGTKSNWFVRLAGKNSVSEWNARRISGFVSMGLIPVLIISTTDLFSLYEVGINLKWHPDTWWWLLIFVGIVTVLIFFSSGSDENLSQYPQIRKKDWSAVTFFYEFGGWFIYLVGYEVLFRGILLFGTIPLIGETAAIALNVAIYSLAHMVKGWQETFGSIILGIILCYFTILSGSIWFALSFHVLQAWIHSIFSFKQHPDFHYVR